MWESQFLPRLAPIRVAVLVAFILAAAGWLSLQYLDPALAPKGDGGTYIVLGQTFRVNGFLSAFGTVRSYGYPSLLYLLTFAPGAAPGSPGAIRLLALYAGALQLAAYGLTVVWLASLVRSRSPRLALAVLAGLILNPMALL